MIHHENKSAITPELEAEFQAAVRQAMSSRRDPEAMRKAAERMDRMREETYRLNTDCSIIGRPAAHRIAEALPPGRASRMKYVLDSSVAFKWVVPESDTPRAVQLRDEFRAAVHELIAPDVFPPDRVRTIAEHRIAHKHERNAKDGSTMRSPG